MGRESAEAAACRLAQAGRSVLILERDTADFYEQAVPEGCFDSEIYPGVYEDPIRVDRDGYVHAPTKPGLGFGIDMAEAEKVAIEIL